MAYYEDDLLDKVLNANDIVDVVGSYVQLQRKGNTYFGLCPFHGEKTASFSVSQKKQMFYCFGCHKGGSAFNFLMEMENITFPEAVEKLAQQGGIDLPKREFTPEQARKKETRDNLQEIVNEAAKYYYTVLQSDEGKRGREYFEKRGLREETIKKFGLGFSTMKGGLYEHLKALGYSDDNIMKSGIVSFSEKDGFRDKFWNRVMFPIMNDRGKIIALGGRVTGDGEPKYLNSSESDIFYKRKTFYGLNFARKSRLKGKILCEGYMDVISLHQAGFDNAMAALGTAFTEEHSRMLPSFVKDLVYLCFDSDGPGRDAILRAIPLLDDVGIRAKVIDMSPHKDPDEFIKEKGADAFRERIENAENSFLFELKCKADKTDRADPTEESEFQDYAFTEAFLRYGSDPMTLNVFVKSICQKFDIDGNLAKDKINKLSRERIPRQMVKPKEEGEVKLSKAEVKKKGISKKQTLLLHYLSEYHSLYGQVKEFITPLDFDPPTLRRAAEMLYEQLEKGEVNPQSIIREFTDPEETQIVTGIFFETLTDVENEDATEKPEEVAKGLTQLVRSIKEESISREAAQNTLSFQDKINSKKILEAISNTRFTV